MEDEGLDVLRSRVTRYGGVEFAGRAYNKVKFKLMNKSLSLGLLVAGILLIIFGVQASHSFNSQVSRFFSGSPTDKAIWMLIAGVIASVVGLVALVRETGK
jgi:uncharacterized membrane-anchored protein